MLFVRVCVAASLAGVGFSHSPDADRASLTGDPDDIPREPHHTTPEMLEAELKVLFPKVGGLRHTFVTSS